MKGSWKHLELRCLHVRASGEAYFRKEALEPPGTSAILTVYEGVRIRSASPCAGSIFSHSFQNLEVS